jgi:hypothetical protein
VLRGLGWEIVRAWSVEWWLNANDAAEKLNDQLLKIRERARVRRPEREAAFAARRELEDRTGEAEAASNPEAAPAGLRPESGDSLERERLRHVIRAVVAEQSPIHADALCRAVGKQLGLGRAGGKLRSAVLDEAGEMFRQSAEDVGSFFWSEGQSPETCRAFRSRGPDEPCRVGEIAMPELAALAGSVQHVKGGDPVLRMARGLGLARVGAAARSRLEAAWIARRGTSS